MADDHQGQTAEAVVASFATQPDRFEGYLALRAIGPAAIPAVHAGLEHEDWHVRHWCAIYLDRHGAPDSILHLIPMLRDPAVKVRLWAVHSIACTHCKTHGPPVDVVPLLLDRIEHDESRRVRKMAAAMLAELPPDPRVVPVLEVLLADERDAKTCLHARRALDRHRAAGMVAG